MGGNQATLACTLLRLIIRFLENLLKTAVYRVLFHCSAIALDNVLPGVVMPIYES